MADLAAGHGLLAWCLLLLDEVDSHSIPRQRPDRTLICIDRRKPLSADVIARATIEQYPQLEERWTYIESDLTAVVPDPSCVLVSVHACGTLSDLIISMSLSSMAPLALVPCCHTINQDHMGYRPHKLSKLTADDVAQRVIEEREKQREHHQPSLPSLQKQTVLAQVLDAVRCQTLRNAGYEVHVTKIPEQFTPRNRLLVGFPPSIPSVIGEHQAAPVSSVARILLQQAIPLADKPESILQCHAMQTKRDVFLTSTLTVLRNPPTCTKSHHLMQHLSFWLAEDDETLLRSVSLHKLQLLADHSCADVDPGLQCAVETLGPPQYHASTRKHSQLYQFMYTTIDGSPVKKMTRAHAKQVHQNIRQQVKATFGDDMLRS